MASSTIDSDIHITGSLSIGGSLPEYARSQLAQDGSMLQGVPLESLRVFDAFATLLPGTPAADDLGLVGGTFGTDVPFASTGDVKAAGCTRKARFTIQLPAEYVTGQSAFIRANAGMKTTIADGSATIDFSAYLMGTGTSGSVVSGSDLVTTAAQSINSLTWANKDFALDPTDLAAGSRLDVLMTITVVDTATPTAVIAGARPDFACSIKG